MYRLLILALVPLVFTWVSAAPPTSNIVSKLECIQSQISSMCAEENSIIDNSNSSEEKGSVESSEEVNTERHIENRSESSVFVQTSLSELPETKVTAEVITAEEELSTRDDQSTVETSRSSHQETPEQPTQKDETASENPAAETATTSAAPSTITAATSTTKRPKPSKKPKPPRATTVILAESPVTAAVTVPSVAVKPTKPASSQRYPCRCGDGICSCCTGIILENFNVPLRSRACANVTYEPDDFAFNFKLAYNNIVLYNRRMSAKNPRPACIPINRYFGVKMCAKLYNVYMSGRNMHACLDFEGFFADETAFKYSFNCFRVGSQGVAIVRPEDGGGLPPPPDEEEQIDEDYDDSARALKSEGIEQTSYRSWEAK